MAAVDQPVRCLVCDSPLGDPVYDSANPVAVTSLCELRKAPTVVRFCPRCGHLQTEALPGLVGYYDQDYKILIDSEEEDQLYAVVKGRKIFRTEHQVETLLNKVALPSSARVLDYGCAKSSTLRQVLVRRPDVIPYVFDVSEMYRPFWEKFVPAANCATYESKPEWANHFDLVTSFFALEHVIEPCAALQTIVRLLKAGRRPL